MYEVGDQVACALCCNGRHTPVPAGLLGKVEKVLVSEYDGKVTYMVRLPSNMIDFLSERTARPEAPDASDKSRMRHALGD